MSFVSSPPPTTTTSRFFLFCILIIPFSPSLLSLYSEESYHLVLQIALLRTQSCHLCKYVKTTSPNERFGSASQHVDQPRTPLPNPQPQRRRVDHTIRNKCCFSSTLLVASFSSVIITVVNDTYIYRASDPVIVLTPRTFLVNPLAPEFPFKF